MITGPHAGLVFTIGRSDFNGPRGINKGWQNFRSSIADDNRRGTSHTAFTRAAESRFDYAAGGILHIRIRHDKNKVLRPTIGLHSLAVLRADFENVFGNWGGPDE